MSNNKSIYGLAREFGVIQDGCNAFTMHSVSQAPTRREIQLVRDRINSAAKRKASKGMTKAQMVALALRSPEERKADRAAMLNARKAEVLKVQAFSGVGYADQATTDKFRKISRAAI